MPKVKVYNTAHLMEPHVHGIHRPKTLLTLHETISHDVKGLGDILAVERDLANRDYGIHGMNDAEGNMAWAIGLGNAIFWQAGGVNEISVGIEQVSDIPAMLQAKQITLVQARKMWLERDAQLRATAKLIACWHNSDKGHHVIKYVDGTGNHWGVTTHWDVSQHHKESLGHWDCQPVQHGGHYPITKVIDYALAYAKQGYHF